VLFSITLRSQQVQTGCSLSDSPIRCVESTTRSRRILFFPPLGSLTRQAARTLTPLVSHSPTRALAPKRPPQRARYRLVTTGRFAPPCTGTRTNVDVCSRCAIRRL